MTDLGIDVKLDDDAELIKGFRAAAGDEVDDAATELTAELVPDVLRLWSSGPVQAAWARRSEFWVLDAAAYYFAHAARIARADFVPNDEDAVMARVITTGIVETSYTDAGTDMTLVDVGGQRSERRKWIRCFDGVDAVIFVCALPEYNQVLYEDASANRMKESLKLFGQVAANPAFHGTPLFLFLNKKDLFEQMMVKTDLSVTFPEYSGGRDAAKGAAFVTALFEDEFRKAVGPVPAFLSFVVASRVRMDVRETMKTVRGVLAPSRPFPASGGSNRNASIQHRCASAVCCCRAACCASRAVVPSAKGGRAQSSSPSPMSPGVASRVEPVELASGPS